MNGIDDIGGLRASLDATHETLKGTNERLDQLDRQSRRQRITLVLLAALMVAVFFVWRHDEVQRCTAGNALRSATVQEVESAMQLLGETLDAPQAQIDGFLARLETRRLEPLKPHTCSYLPDL